MESLGFELIRNHFHCIYFLKPFGFLLNPYNSQGASMLSINPTYLNAFYNRGCAKDDLENYKGAIADYTKVIELDPTDSDAFNGKGICLSKLNRLDEALVSFDTAIKHNPNKFMLYELWNKVQGSILSTKILSSE